MYYVNLPLLERAILKKNTLFYVIKAEKRATLERELLYFSLKNPKAVSLQKFSEYKWTGSGSELLELMLALFASGRIKQADNSQVKFTAFANDFQKFCNYKIADIKGRKMRLLMRKKNPIPFIQQLGESLIAHIHQYFE